ncbi:MAG: hypothetical protein ABFE13_12005 [Phycisphaerales bacterium]
MSEEKVRYPEGHAAVSDSWEHDGLKFTVLFVDMHYGPHGGHYCGYVRFPKRPVREPGYEGIIAYVPVHGGVTYDHQDEDGSMVYGFDCGHYDDDNNPDLRNPKWLHDECERMAVAILLAAKYERRYLRNTTNAGKAKALDEYHDELRKTWGREVNSTEGFGVMINLLSGRL